MCIRDRYTSENFYIIWQTAEGCHRQCDFNVIPVIPLELKDILSEATPTEVVVHFIGNDIISTKLKRKYIIILM